MENVRKKLRIEHGPSALRYVTYFDTLPIEVRAKIIEWFNKSSKNTQGSYTVPENYGDTRFLSLVFSENSPFRDLALTMFSEICFVLTKGETEVNGKDGSITVGRELFEGEALESGLDDQLMKTCGASLIKISIMRGIGYDDSLEEAEEKQFIQQFAVLVIKHCSNVEELEFDGSSAWHDIISILCTAFFSQMCSIAWWPSIREDYYCLPNFNICKNIEHLVLPVTPQLVSILNSCGATLFTIDITFGDDMEGCAELIDLLQFNCRQLKDISLGDSHDVINVIGEERYVTFLCSYGAQLIAADTQALSTENFLRVTATCVNLPITSLTVENNGNEQWERVSVVGPRIETLWVDINSCTGERCTRAMAKCTNLAVLGCIVKEAEQECDADAVINLLSSISSSLRVLYLFDFSVTQQNIALIASATSNLRVLQLKPKGPIKDGKIFSCIVDSNPHIHNASIEENVKFDGEREADSAVELLQVLVNMFSKCRTIKFGILNTSERNIDQDVVHNICGFLPCRGVQVEIQIGSTFYRQRGRL